MRDRQPTETTNLDRYGGGALPWRLAHDLLANGPKGPMVGFFLGTVGPDGRPHAAGVGAVWHDGDLYFTSGPGTRKSRNLAGNRGRLHGALQSAERRPAAVAPLPVHHRLGGRAQDRGAERRDALAVRPAGLTPAARPGSGRRGQARSVATRSER